MTVDHIRYDLLTQEALRGVMQRVLADAAKHGLPGEHHFYVAFDTNAEGVTISPRLKAQYPTEITIVLQHQFWDLTVLEDRFEVGLAFGGVPERLVVPFAAIKGFFDPSVQFGLQFETGTGQDGSVLSAAAPPAGMNEAAAGRPMPTAVPSVPQPAAAMPDEAEPEPAPPPASGGAEVVSLDRFRKK